MPKFAEPSEPGARWMPSVIVDVKASRAVAKPVRNKTDSAESPDPNLQRVTPIATARLSQCLRGEFALTTSAWLARRQSTDSLQLEHGPVRSPLRTHMDEGVSRCRWHSLSGVPDPWAVEIIPVSATAEMASEDQ